MATTRIMPLHAGKGRTVGKAISDIIDYVKNPDKTDHGRLITSYQCDSRVADAQFLLDKQTYACLLYTSPWRPGDLAQLKDRIERQGNQNETVHVYRYVTEGTFDAYTSSRSEHMQTEHHIQQRLL